MCRPDPNLKKARPNIAVDTAALLPGDSRFGLHPALAPLHPFWTKGQLAAVHAVYSPDASRSHFQAQDCPERGTAATTTHTGWLDRTLSAMGPGTTFRAIAEGDATPRSMLGVENKLVLDGIEAFALAGPGNVRDRRGRAAEFHYRLTIRPRTAPSPVRALNQIWQLAAPVRRWPIR